MVTREEQLANPANWEADDGTLFLERCVACGGDKGTENWVVAVCCGYCAFCGWKEEKEVIEDET